MNQDHYERAKANFPHLDVLIAWLAGETVMDSGVERREFDARSECLLEALEKGRTPLFARGRTYTLKPPSMPQRW